MSKQDKWSVRELFFALTAAFAFGVTIVVVIQAVSRDSVDWAGLASMIGALFTGGSVIFAVVAFRHDLKRREIDDANVKRMAARGVLFSPAWTFGGNTVRNTQSALDENNSVVESPLRFDSFLEASVKVDNTSLQPIYKVTLIAILPPSLINEKGQLFPPGIIEAMKPQSTSQPLNLKCVVESAQDMLDDRVVLEVRFTDIWGQRWATNGLDTYPISAEQERDEPNYD